MMSTVFYKKYLLLLVILSIFFPLNAYAGKEDKFSCNTKDIDKFINAEKIKFINIATPKSKKWAKNYFAAVRNPGNVITKKYKKKFNANIKVEFDNELECVFSAKIRINGDWKDHLTGIGSVTSLDVKLLSGNINSIVKFKLFIPRTKGGDNEIFSTTFLKELGFLAPRTYYAPAIFNDIKFTFLFQEKITKEFIELNNLREAPILEGDERFFFENALNISDRFVLVRVVNNKWVKKGDTSFNISKMALTQLNKVYLEYLSGMHIYKNRNGIFLKPNAFSRNNFIEKDREFRSILMAMGASHALRPHNRNFYYDPMYGYFRFIYYDGNSQILKFNNNILLKNELGKDAIIGSSFAIKSLNKLNPKHFVAQLKKNGLSYNLKKVNIILNTLMANLKIIKNTQIINHQKNSYVPYFSNYKNETKKEEKMKLVFSTETKSQVEVCNFLLTSCYYDKLSIKKYSKLLAGRYLDGSPNAYIFIGNKQEYLTGINIRSHDKKTELTIEKETQLVVYGTSKALINKEKKSIRLRQSNIKDRFLIRGGRLKDWHIKLIGLTKGRGKGKKNNEQRFNQNLLTGCLTLLDLNIDNLSVEVDGALCEDGVNFIRVNGSINRIVVKNATSDAMDADFSKLNFKNINIKNAGNDCVDLSSGDYRIENANLFNCKDKAISVGEKAKVIINTVKILKSGMGVVAKDSSIVEVNSVIANATPICFSAYNKKQEFWGGKIIANKHNCQSNQIIQEQGSLIKFIQ